MGALGWMLAAGVPALSVVAALALKRRAGRSSQAPASTASGAAPLPPQVGPALQVDNAVAVIADGRELLFRLHALPFAGTAAGAEPSTAEMARHADVANACANLLERSEFHARHMPRRPQLLPKLMRAINDPEASLERITGVIAEDPVLSANLLRIANSPYFRTQKEPVESLMRAASLLGLDGLRPVVAAALVQPVMQTGDSAFGQLPVLIWEHTRLAADFASGLVRGAHRKDDAFSAQLLGLLHGLGAILVAQALRDSYALHPQLRPDPRTVARVLDAYSAPVARSIAASWEMSERIGAALDAQQLDAMPADALGRALCAGRVAAALAMLYRQGAMERDDCLLQLSAWAGAHAVQDALVASWSRLNP